jgi:uncharacterized protein YmfQ (DUF2313 family)
MRRLLQERNATVDAYTLYLGSLNKEYYYKIALLLGFCVVLDLKLQKTLIFHCSLLFIGFSPRGVKSFFYSACVS